jgi:hypothetical protein
MDDYPAYLALAVFAAALSADGDPDIAVNSEALVLADRIHRLADGALLASSYSPVSGGSFSVRRPSRQVKAVEDLRPPNKAPEIAERKTALPRPRCQKYIRSGLDGADSSTA